MLKYLLLVLVLLSPGLLRGQEVQIAFDSAGKVVRITPELQQQLHLFPAYPGLTEADLYKRPDNTKYVDITYYELDVKHRHVEEISDSALLDLRRKLSAAAIQANPDLGLDQSSRMKFIVWQSVLATFVTSPLLAAGFTDNSSPNVTGYALIGGALGFVIPYLATAHSNVTDGESSLALGGSFLGYGHGALLAGLISDNDGRVLDLAMAGMSILETGIGFAVADRYKIHEGKADVIRYTGVLGALEGMGVAYMVGGSGMSSKVAFGLGLVGSGLGLAGGAMLASDQHYTRGNASVLMTAALLGGTSLSSLTAAAVLENQAFESDPGRLPVAAGVVGSVVGYYGAHRYLSNKRLSTAEGNYVILGTALGYLAGEGVAIIAIGKGDRNLSAWTLVLPTVIGSAAGFLLMLNSAGVGSEHEDVGVNIGFNPGNWMAATTKTDPRLIAPTALTLGYNW